jgi:hypothetical protein
MRILSHRLIGFILLVGALVGVGFSLVSLQYIWRIEEPISQSLSRNLDLIDSTLQTSADGLEIVSISLEQTIQTVALLKGASENLTASMESSIPSIEQSSTLIEEDLVDVINNTITSLESSQASARLIDDTLGFITSLPLVGQRYAPALPLSESIGLVQNSLIGLPDSLIELGQGMRQTANNLRGIQTEIMALSADVQQAESSLTQSQEVIQEYQTQVRTSRGG